MSSSANVSGSDDQMDIEEDETNQPADPMFKGQTMFNRPPPKIFGQNPMPSNDFSNKDNRGPNFDDVSNSGNSSHDRDGDMKEFRDRGNDRDRDNRNRGNRRDYSNERGGGRNSNSRWSSDGRGRSRENDRITPSDGNNRDFNNSRNNIQWRDAQPNQMNFNNSYMDQQNPRMNIGGGGGGPPALEDMRLPIPLDNLRGGPMGQNCKLSAHIFTFSKH